MNYLGQSDTLSTVETGVTSAASSAAQIAALAQKVSYWQSVVASATSAYDQAVANQELAKYQRELAQAKAAAFGGKQKLYTYAIVGGVGLLAVIVVVGTMWRKRRVHRRP